MRPRHSDEFDEIDNAIEHLFSQPATVSDKQWDHCREDVQSIVEDYRFEANELPEIETQDDRLANEIFEFGELFRIIAEKIEYLSPPAAFRFIEDFSEHILGQFRLRDGESYLRLIDGVSHRLGPSEAKELDQISEALKQLSSSLCQMYRYKEVDPKAGRPISQRPKNQLVLQCLCLFEAIRPNQSQKTAGDFPKFVELVYQHASGDDNPTLDHAIRRAFKVLSSGACPYGDWRYTQNHG